MKIVRAKVMGFCAGVRRAVLLAEQAAERAAGHPVYSLGKIVHNNTVTDRLAGIGITVLEDGAIPPQGAVVLIRSHGVHPSQLQKLRDSGSSIVDATCPKVVANQRTAARQAASGRKVVIAGDEGHGEVMGLAGHVPGAAVIPDSLKAQSWHHDGPVALIAQTTMSQAEVDGIVSALKANNSDVIVAGGICGATADRQAALRELLPQVDAVVVVGGKDSANTRRLTAIAHETGKPVWQVANADEISDDLAGQLCRLERIGLSAGASTPDEAIDAVERRLMELAGSLEPGEHNN
jgi:4-hydroxy-3-methylbut-2-en-1-yl diphosphate reductase